MLGQNFVSRNLVSWGFQMLRLWSVVTGAREMEVGVAVEDSLGGSQELQGLGEAARQQRNRKVQLHPHFQNTPTGCTSDSLSLLTWRCFSSCIFCSEWFA